MPRDINVKKLENGYQVVEHPGSVAVIPVIHPTELAHYSETNMVVLCEQFRDGPQESVIEIPAGTRDVEGESPMDCALRELEEELGYKASYICSLGNMYPSPGYCSEVINLFVAGGLKEMDTKPEFEPITLTVGMLLNEIATGAIQDAKTIVALTRWNLLSKELPERVKWLS